MLKPLVAIAFATMATSASARVFEVTGNFTNNVKSLQVEFEKDISGKDVNEGKYLPPQMRMTILGVGKSGEDVPLDETLYWFGKNGPGYWSYNAHASIRWKGQFREDLSIDELTNPNVWTEITWSYGGPSRWDIPNPMETCCVQFGGSISSFREISAVPEPETWALQIAGFGLIGIFARARRRMVSL